MKANQWLLSTFLFSCVHGYAGNSSSVPAVARVAVVVFENENSEDVMEAPFFKDFAARGANATQFFAETHPSQANYVAMTAGNMFGVRGDANVDLDVKHIGDLLEDAGKTWKVYAEGYPGNCFLGARAGNYVR